MAVLPLLTALLLTQSATDSLPFHRGQWAAQFAGGLNFASLGFLKFRSTKRALMVDIRVDGGHGEDLATDSTGTHFAGVGSHANLDIRFGWPLSSGRSQGRCIPIIGFARRLQPQCGGGSRIPERKRMGGTPVCSGTSAQATCSLPG